MVSKRVIVAMSGGVDSAVAALLMKSAGHRVKGVFMHNWDELDETGHCSVDQEYRAVEDICQRLDIPCGKVTFVKEYWNNVFSEMLRGYQDGLTPNPDIWCNERIKFGTFLQYTSGADMIATGHYARIKHDGKVLKLWESMDKHKDQSYFLSTLSQKALEKVVFPIGDLKKAEVKQLAIDAGFADVAAKKESMGLCFVGQRKFSHFIKEYLDCQPGSFVMLDGKVVGQHSGHLYYTIGQRSGLSLDNSAYYVASKNLQTNEIVVVPGAHHEALYCNVFCTHQPHWISATSPITADTYQCTVRDRRGPISAQCVVREQGDGLQVMAVNKPFRAVTPGQYAVFYDSEECLGAAVISNAGPSLRDNK